MLDEEAGLLSTAEDGAEVTADVNGRRLRFVAKTVAATLVGFFLGCAVSWHAHNHKFSGPSPLDSSLQQYPLKFLVVGDWGREGAYNQTLVAKQMGRVGRQLGVEFVLSVGDNFYQSGLKGPHDPKFLKSFSNVYTEPSLQTQWYSVLGNHDYLGDTLVQLGDALTKRDKRWFCQRSYQLQFPLCGPSYTGNCENSVELFLIDTTPFVDSYWSDEEKRHFDWRGIGNRTEYLESQLKTLSSALEFSVATWKIVVGHHTIRSLGRHGDTHELVKQVLPILESRDVDLYINGHDHCLEYIKREDSKVHFITSGGGSKSFQGLQGPTDENGLQFGYDGQGFISVSIAAKALNIQFHDALGNSLYNLDLHK